RTAVALILIDDLDAIRRPTKFNRQVNESVLTRSRFLMVEHLLRSRLPHINERRSFEMVRMQFVRWPPSRRRRMSRCLGGNKIFMQQVHAIPPSVLKEGSDGQSSALRSGRSPADPMPAAASRVGLAGP